MCTLLYSCADPCAFKFYNAVESAEQFVKKGKSGLGFSSKLFGIFHNELAINAASVYF